MFTVTYSNENRVLANQLINVLHGVSFSYYVSSQSIIFHGPELQMKLIQLAFDNKDFLKK